MSEDNPYSPPVAEVVVESPHAELATRGARLGASFIDGLIVMTVFFAVLYLTNMVNLLTDTEPTLMQALFGFVAGSGTFFLLNGYLLAKYGQTIGKRILSIQIVSVEDGEILPIWKLVLLRYLPLTVVSQIPLLGAIVSLADPLFIFRDDRRCLHDLIAGSRVVRTNPGEA